MRKFFEIVVQNDSLNLRRWESCSVPFAWYKVISGDIIAKGFRDSSFVTLGAFNLSKLTNSHWIKHFLCILRTINTSSFYKAWPHELQNLPPEAAAPHDLQNFGPVVVTFGLLVGGPPIDSVLALGSGLLVYVFAVGSCLGVVFCPCFSFLTITLGCGGGWEEDVFNLMYSAILENSPGVANCVR